MFEKYDIDELYACTIKKYVPFSIKNRVDVFQFLVIR